MEMDASVSEADDRNKRFLDNDPSELVEDDPKHKVNDVILETDIILKESEHGDAMKQQRSTDSRTTSPPENLGFINAAKNELDPESTQASKKRRWKPNFLNKPDEGYDHAWLSGERRSKGRILLKGCGKDPKPGVITKKKVLQPTLVASEEFAVLEALEEKHEKDDKKNVPSRYRDKRRRSSVEESGAEALGSVFSITKESNFAKTSKEQCKRKNSPSQKEGLGSVSNTKESNFLKTYEEQNKRKSSPVQKEPLDPVSITKQSNFPETSKKQLKMKNYLSQEKDSADRVVGEELVGCRVRVWWPLDQMFYEGHITLFDHSEKKHMVIYDDGDQEMLNLTKEQWELVEDASVPTHKIIPSPSDSSDMRLDCIIDSYRQIRKNKENTQNHIGRRSAIDHTIDQYLSSWGGKIKMTLISFCSLLALNVDEDVPVLTPGIESKKIVCSKEKLSRGKATDDPTPPSTMTMQQNVTPKGVHQNKGIKVGASESVLEGKSMSWTTPIKMSTEDGDVCSELVHVHVHGYKVKLSTAPILEAIFSKYGDITVNCHYKSPIVRASFLDVVCDVVRRLKTSDFNSSSIKAMKSIVSDVVDAKLDVTWLQQYLDEIFEEEDMEEKFSYLMALSETTKLVSKATKKDLVERNREILAAEKRLKKAERCLQEAQSRAGEAKRSVNVFDVLGKKVQQDVKEVEDQARYWLSRLNELLYPATVLS